MPAPIDTACARMHRDAPLRIVHVKLALLGARIGLDQMQPTFTTRPDIRGTFGAVATTHWLATQTGMAVLERGGNAFDAAVAAGFVLQIVLRAGAQAPEVICGQ